MGVLLIAVERLMSLTNVAFVLSNGA